MNNGPECPNFGNRLKYLYEQKSVNTDKWGWSLDVAHYFFDKGILQYSDKTEKTEYQQRADVSNQLKRHLLKPEPPSSIWLLRYQKYFGCSVDFLLGIIDAPTYDIKTAHDITGLSVEAIEILKEISYIPYFTHVLSTFIENHNLKYYLALLRTRFSSVAFPDKDKEKFKYINTEIYGEKATIEAAGLIDSIFSTHIVQDLPDLSREYIEIVKRENERERLTGFTRL